jgi:hypothetical protein
MLVDMLGWLMVRALVYGLNLGALFLISGPDWL